MQKRDIKTIENRIETLEKLLGSNNLVVDSNENPVNLNPILKRLSEAKDFK